jgi:hypothetical protein
MIPLHHAIAYSLDSEYNVQYLVERCPESLHVQDKRGRLPLHHINDDTHLEVVELWSSIRNPSECRTTMAIYHCTGPPSVAIKTAREC